MSNAVSLWRIASETPRYRADDLSGQGAEASGGRWNDVGVPVIYTSTTRALACLETVVHLVGARALPLNRYLVEIVVPAAVWEERERFDASRYPAWDALPAGMTSIRWGSDWARGRQSVLADVPSVIVPEESNVLINPLHPSAVQLTAIVRRRWLYDGRIA